MAFSNSGEVAEEQQQGADALTVIRRGKNEDEDVVAPQKKKAGRRGEFPRNSRAVGEISRGS